MGRSHSLALRVRRCLFVSESCRVARGGEEVEGSRSGGVIPLHCIKGAGGKGSGKRAKALLSPA